jgi:hypothetical protein
VDWLAIALNNPAIDKIEEAITSMSGDYGTMNASLMERPAFIDIEGIPRNMADRVRNAVLRIFHMHTPVRLKPFTPSGTRS